MNNEEEQMIASSRMLLCICLVPSFLHGMNLLRPYDSLLRPAYAYSEKAHAQFSIVAETGISDKGYNSVCSANVMRIWNGEQNALAMLCGFASDNPIGEKKIAIDASDDGIRGHFCVDGDLHNRFSSIFGVRAFFRENWSLGIYLPFYAMALKNVCWKDQTKRVSDEDIRVRELLTDDFFCNVKKLGNGLDLSGWSRNGVGDLTLMVDWFRDFPQAKPMLKNVRLNWRLGLGIPTGLHQDVDNVLAFPFGYDGAVSLPFGLGLDLQFIFHVKVGFDVQLTHVFGNTRTRRFKTSIDQTDLLFLQKGDVYKDWGLTQQFNLYAQLYKLFGSNVSFMLGYQYYKHGTDEVALAPGSPFSATIANSAIQLQDWTLHQFVVRADYDIGGHLDDPTIYPRFALYAQIPFNGKRVAATTNLGLIASIDF